MRAIFLLPCLTVASLAACQVPESNPTINFTTPAVRASVAVEQLGRTIDRKLKVDPALADEPLIIRVKNGTYENTLQWIALALQANWEERQDHRVLRRPAAIELQLRNVLARGRSTKFFELVQNRVVSHSHSPLTEETAKQTILDLKDPNRPGYARAVVNSADVRLVDRALVAVNSSDIASRSIFGRWVFSSRPRQLQGPLRLTDEELAKLYQQQNLWTSALAALATTHPELKAQAAQRRTIDPRDARVVLVLAAPVMGMPTRADASIVDSRGKEYVRAWDTLPRAPEPTFESVLDLRSLRGLAVNLGPLSTEYVAAVNAESPVRVSDALRSALLEPLDNDPVRLGASDALISIADARNINLVACLPDAAATAAMLRPAPSDAASWITAIARHCELLRDGTGVVIRPRETRAAEVARADRRALREYLASVERTGISSNNAESSFYSTSGWTTDPGLPRSQAAMLRPQVAALAGSPPALAWYGMMDVERKRALFNGWRVPLAELTEAQREPLHPLTFGRFGTLYFGDKPAPARGIASDLTELVDGLNAARDVNLESGRDTVIRVVGVTTDGESVDRYLTLKEAQTLWKGMGPWQTVSVSSGPANFMRVWVGLTEQAKIAHYMLEFPEGMSPLGPVQALPAKIRSTLLGEPGPKPMVKKPAAPPKTGGPKKSKPWL